MFFLIGGIFLQLGHFFKLGVKNYFGIEKISCFGNNMDPCFRLCGNGEGAYSFINKGCGIEHF